MFPHRSSRMFCNAWKLSEFGVFSGSCFPAFLHSCIIAYVFSPKAGEYRLGTVLQSESIHRGEPVRTRIIQLFSHREIYYFAMPSEGGSVIFGTLWRWSMSQKIPISTFILDKDTSLHANKRLTFIENKPDSLPTNIEVNGNYVIVKSNRLLHLAWQNSKPLYD